MNIIIANRLVELRKKYGYSQEQLADKLGLSRQAVSKWERAEASPDTDNLICLAKLYNVSLDDLLSTDQSIDDIREENQDREEEKKKEEEYQETASDSEKKESKVDISFEHGIHVVDNDGSEVHIDKTGIHCHDKDGSKCDIKDGVVYTEKANSKKSQIIFGIISGSLALVIAIIYIILGCVLGGQGWAVYWTLFLLIPIVPSVFSAIEKKKFTDFAYPVLVTFVYLFLGMYAGLWHPYWVLFLTIPVYYIIFDPIDKYNHRIK